jgi:hypothetical protein
MEEDLPMLPRPHSAALLAVAPAVALLTASTGGRAHVLTSPRQNTPPSIDSFEGLRALAPTADDLPGYNKTGERVPAGGPPSVAAAYSALWVLDDQQPGSGGIQITLSTFDNVDDPSGFVEQYFANTQASQANQDPAVQLVDLGAQGIGDEDDAVYRTDGDLSSYTIVFRRGRVYSFVSMFGPGDFATLDQVAALASLTDERIAAVPQ